MIKKILFFSILLAFLTSTAFASKTSAADSKDFSPKPASASIYNLGLKSYENGDLDSAISFFKRAIELDPRFVDAHYNLGVIYKKQKDLPLAIHHFRKAYEIDVEDHEVTFELASCYLEAKDYENARRYFALIPKDFPRYDEAMQNLQLANHPAVPQNSNIPQEQLLVNTLTKPPSQNPKPQAAGYDQSQLLVDTLTNNKNVMKRTRVITSDFNGPTGIAKDSQNNLYIANFKSDTIERITHDGRREVFLSKGGISGPVGLAIDGANNLYVANYKSNSILKITPDKTVSILQDGIKNPYYLFHDPFSNKLFVTVQGNDALVEIDTYPVEKRPVTSR